MSYSIEIDNISKTFQNVKRRLWFQDLPEEESTDPNVSITRLTKYLWKSQVKRTQALDEVSLKVPKGEILGLLGPNGAGKTTLAKIVSTLVLPDSGLVKVNGYNVAEETVMARFSIGLVTGGERSLYWKLTPLQNLRFFGNLYGMSRSEATNRAIDLLKIFGLKSKTHELVQDLSTGQKMRVAFARGLMHDPEILILDEYNRGLDPNVSLQLRNYIKQVLQKEEDKTVLLMTHEMNVAEDLCNRVTLIDNGKIIAQGTPQQLMNNLTKKIVVDIETQSKVTTSIEKQLQAIGDLEISNNGNLVNTKLIVENSSDVIYDIFKIFRLGGVNIENFNYKKANLEDVFVHFTGKKLTNGGDNTDQ
jgi:ABC-2 type transport system ATP-binding protein